MRIDMAIPVPSTTTTDKQRKPQTGIIPEYEYQLLRLISATDGVSMAQILTTAVVQYLRDCEPGLESLLESRAKALGLSVQDYVAQLLS